MPQRPCRKDQSPPYRDGRGGKFLTWLTLFFSGEDALRSFDARSEPVSQVPASALIIVHAAAVPPTSLMNCRRLPLLAEAAGRVVAMGGRVSTPGRCAFDRSRPPSLVCGLLAHLLANYSVRGRIRLYGTTNSCPKVLDFPHYEVRGRTRTNGAIRSFEPVGNRPLVRSYGVISTSTLSPASTRMRF
jgi:hypothetical protein